ncbi:MAG: PHP domain-containing protein [Coprococcus sp.]
MDRIDLHTHSNASDGSMTPSELMIHAKEAGLRAVALTDHDTTEGLAEARQAAEETDIELVCGVELAAWQDKTELHIVGLDIDEKQPEFLAAMKEMQQIREDRNRKMIELMANAGVDITLEKLHEKEGAGVLTRANFARYLVSVGFVTSIDEAFKRYLDNGRPFYLPRKKITPERAITLIKSAGGIPVLAHPMLYRLGKQTLEKYVCLLKEMGLEGMEVYYSTNTPSDDLYLSHLANRYDLKYSGGSDFHGTYKPHIKIGTGKGRLVISYDILEKLRKR